jgi:hypothetical protein
LTIRAPTSPGFYWAMWQICDEGTADEAEFEPSYSWAVVEVFISHMDPDHPEHLRVHVPGVAQGQRIENFVWGSGSLVAPPRRFHLNFFQKGWIYDLVRRKGLRTRDQEQG